MVIFQHTSLADTAVMCPLWFREIAWNIDTTTVITVPWLERRDINQAKPPSRTKVSLHRLQIGGSSVNAEKSPMGIELMRENMGMWASDKP